MCQIVLVSDELEGMTSKQLCWSLLCGTISGIIAVLVFKFLENRRAREEIREDTADRNKPDKEPQENDERTDKRPEEHEDRLR